MTASRKEVFQKEIDNIAMAFSGTDGDLSAAVHQEVVRYTAVKFNNIKSDTAVSSELTPLLDKIALHAYKVTDKDTDKLQAAGYIEEQLFEVIVGGALGAGLASWQKGISVIDAFFGTEGGNNAA